MKNLSPAFLQAELSRISEWIKFSDQKSAFLFVYYSAVFGSIVFIKYDIYSNLLNYKNWQLYLYITLISLTAFLFLGGIFFLLSCIFPRLKNNLTNKSLFYFGNIADMKFVDYIKQIEELSEDETKKQLVEQIYTNSMIANTKMKNIRISTIFLMFLILSSILLFLTS